MRKQLFFGMLFVAMVCLVSSCGSKENISKDSKENGAWAEVKDPNKAVSVIPGDPTVDSDQPILPYATVTFRDKPNSLITSGATVFVYSPDNVVIPSVVNYDGDKTITVRIDLTTAFIYEGLHKMQDRPFTIRVYHIEKGKIVNIDVAKVKFTIFE